MAFFVFESVFSYDRGDNRQNFDTRRTIHHGPMVIQCNQKIIAKGIKTHETNIKIRKFSVAKP